MCHGTGASNSRVLKCAAGTRKHPDSTRDNGLGRSRGCFSTKIHLMTDVAAFY